MRLLMDTSNELRNCDHVVELSAVSNVIHETSHTHNLHICLSPELELHYGNGGVNDDDDGWLDSLLPTAQQPLSA